MTAFATVDVETLDALRSPRGRVLLAEVVASYGAVGAFALARGFGETTHPRLSQPP